MLAQSFKTATDLGIEEAEQRALVTVLGMLEREELAYVMAENEYRATGEACFSMAISHDKQDCGTVACIGGWVGKLNGVNPQDYVNNSHSSKLKKLYWPPTELLDAITPANAAIALRSYLTTGVVNWADAFGR